MKILEVNRSSAFHWSSPPQRLFSHPVLVKGWIVMEKEQGGEKTISRGRGTVMDNLPASTLSGYFRRSHHEALKAVFYCTGCRAGLNPEAFVITCFYSCPLILVPCLKYSLLQRES